MSERGDLEIVRACAAAVGEELCNEAPPRLKGQWNRDLADWEPYDPIHDDAQCFALVKRFELDIAHWNEPEGGANVFHYSSGQSKADSEGSDADLNRAICLCVANLSRAG